MRAHFRSLLIFLGAGMSAAMLAFVSLSRPYTGPQIGMLVVGSLIAGAATAAVEQGLGNNKGQAPPPVPPGGAGGASGPRETGGPAGSAASIDYHALLTPAAPAEPPAAGSGSSAGAGSGTGDDTAPPIGREPTFTAIARLLAGQQEVGG